MNYDYNREGGPQLPAGCKDLIDALKLAQQGKRQEAIQPSPPFNAPFEDFTAELDHLVRLDKKWRDYFAEQGA